VHFFSPVDKMPLVELIKGEKTSDEATYRALDSSSRSRRPRSSSTTAAASSPAA
jgi:3-hydroxyacyl-CoA dehydrogenase/enoyl-CoA hydratase/3-hydroxybutyryl-CoA epimerase